MTSDRTPRFDAYISVSDSLPDKEWVDNVLAPRLKGAGIRFRTNDDLGDPADSTDSKGATSDFLVDLVADAIENSRFTLFVLTSAWLGTGRGSFEKALAQLEDPRGVQRRIIPLWLDDCKIPDTLKIYHVCDLRRQDNRDRQLDILVARLLPIRIRAQGTTTLPPPRRLAQTIFLKLRGWGLEHPIRAVLLAVFFLIVLSALAGYPTAEGWQRINRQNLSLNAKSLTRIGDTLFVMTSTNEGCRNHLDTGLWRSTDHGINWERISIPLDFQTAKGCDRAIVQNIVAAPDNPQHLYAATSDVGILESQDNGSTWHPLNNDAERRQLASVVVLPSPNRIYVVGNVALHYGLYRSTDGKQWERLDTTDRCVPPDSVQKSSEMTGTSPAEYVSLPPTATVNAALTVVENIMYIAPLDTFQTSSAPEKADIYFSSDGGDCWRSIHTRDSNGNTPPRRINYSVLASLPGKPNEILFGTWGEMLGRRIWRRNWETGEQQLLGELPFSASQLLVTDEGERWYAATTFGYLMRGSVRQFDNPERIPGPFTLYAAYTLDFDNRSPLLLGGGNIYRRGMVGWWQAFIP